MSYALNIGFSAMLAEEYFLIVPFAYQVHHGATFLPNINEVYSASAFLFIFSYRTNHAISEGVSIQ
jgi:hypothetical protein